MKKKSDINYEGVGNVNNSIMENKYKQGDIVNERVRPLQKLIVSRLLNKIYYCKIQENPRRKELVFFERELQSDVNSRLTRS